MMGTDSDIKVLKSEVGTLKKRVNDHSGRIDKMENAQIRLDTLMQGIDKRLESIEKALKDGFDAIAKQYVTKETLESILKDGKYAKLVWALIGGLLGAVSIAIVMGVFSASSSLAA